MADFAIGMVLTVGTLVAIGIAVLTVMLVHEAAHALVGAAVGFHVVAIEIGSGPCVRLWWLGRVRIAWCRWPVRGLVYVIIRGRRWLRVRIVLFGLAGPMSTVALAIGCCAMHDHAQDLTVSGSLLDFLQWTTGLMWLMAASSFLPVSVGSHRSDVEMVLLAMCMCREEIERRVAGTAHAECLERFHLAFLRGNATAAAAAVADLELAYPESFEASAYRPLLRLAAGDAVGAMAMHEESEARLRASPTSGEVEPDASAPVAQRRLDAKSLAINRAFFLTHVGTEQALAEARRLVSSWGPINELHGPRRVAALRTRGLVLLHTGAVVQGMQCLQRTLAAPEPYWLRALGMAYLAYGHALRGNERAARRWGRRARTLHPQSLLLPMRLRLVDEALAAAQAERAPSAAMR